MRHRFKLPGRHTSPVRKARPMQVWGLLFGMALASLGLGTWGSFLYLRASGKYASLADALYRAFQLFAFNFYEAGPLPWPLETARWLAPATTLGAVFRSIRMAWEHYRAEWRLASISGHIIVLGGERNVVTDIPGHVIVRGIRNPAAPAVLLSARQLQITLPSPDMLVDHARASAAHAVLIYADDEDEAIGWLHPLAQACRHGDRQNLDVTVMMRASERCARLENLGDRWDPQLRIVATTASRLLLSKCGCAIAATLGRMHKADKPIQVVLIGTAQVVYELAARLATLFEAAPRQPVHIHVAQIDQLMAPTAWQRLAHAAPQIGWQIDDAALPAEALAASPAPDVLVLCPASTSEFLDVLEGHAQCSAAATSTIALIAREWASGAMLQQSVGKGMQTVFLSQAEEVAGCLIEPQLEALAKRIHADYRASTNDQGPANQPWERLASRYRQSSRLQAESIPFKLLALGIAMDAEGVERASLEHAIVDRLESLAEAEHNRWMTEKILAGWKYGSSRDERRRQHPSLLPYKELSDAEREKDRAMWRLLPSLLTWPRDV